MVGRMMTWPLQNLECKSINYDRTATACYIYGEAVGNVQANPSTDYYQFKCGASSRARR